MAMLMATAIAGVAISTVAPTSPVSAAPDEQSAAMTSLLDYLRNQNSTGFLVVQDGKVLVEKHWPAPKNDRQFSLFVYGKNKQGALLEDVASQQKSFVSVLIAIAIDKGLIDVEKPVAAYHRRRLVQGDARAGSEDPRHRRADDELGPQR